MNISTTNTAFSNELIVKGLNVAERLVNFAASNGLEGKIATMMFFLGLNEEEATKFMSADVKVETHIRDDFAKAPDEAKLVFLSQMEKNKDKLSLIKKLLTNKASEEEEKIYVDTTVSILKDIGIDANPELILSETRQMAQNYQAL